MMPIIGNHVSVGSGAVIVGGITIGSHVKIGANTYVDVLASYGVVPFILFIKILYGSVTSTMDRAYSFHKYASLCAFYAVLIMGTFEAAMVAGSMGLNLLTVGLLVLANVDGLERNDYVYQKGE